MSSKVQSDFPGLNTSLCIGERLTLRSKKAVHDAGIAYLRVFKFRQPRGHFRSFREGSERFDRVSTHREHAFLFQKFSYFTMEIISVK